MQNDAFAFRIRHKCDIREYSKYLNACMHIGDGSRACTQTRIKTNVRRTPGLVETLQNFRGSCSARRRERPSTSDFHSLEERVRYVCRAGRNCFLVRFCEFKIKVINHFHGLVGPATRAAADRQPLGWSVFLMPNVSL